MQASIIRCLPEARINWEGCCRKGIQHKNAVMTEVGHGSDAVASGWVVCVPASVVFPRTIKSIRWRAVIEEVDKGCSEFCVTVGTATRTASILIHSWLKALAVNLSWPSSRLWLYAGLIGSINPCWLKAP